MPKQVPRAGAKLMDLITISKVAEKFYNERCPQNIVTGYPKTVLTDGKDTIFISHPGSVNPTARQEIFSVRRLNGITVVEQKG